ncbi:MAG: hypothetical protein KDE26_13510, partial [Bacteroidetes bacterium]|nr:hypothetical protein [Bacteroidota bacterium]
SYDLTSNISLVVELGYNIKIAGSTPKVSFSGETLGDNPTSAAESFNDPNVSLQSYSDFGINTLQKLPVRVRGMQTRIGVIYYLK